MMRLASKLSDWRRHPAKNGLGVAAVLVAVAFLAGPLLWQISTSLRLEDDLAHIGWPTVWSFDNYRSAWSGRSFGQSIVNSAIVAGATTVSSIAIGALAAFALAKFPFRAKNVILGAMLAVSMFPPIATVSPLYILLRWLSLRDTLTALILTYTTFALPFTLTVLVGAFREIPDALYESARLDGCSPLQAFLRVFLPLAAPTMAALAIIVFVFSYNEFLFALTFTSSPEKRTIPVAISLFASDRREPWGEMAAASVMAAVPLVALALAFQRKIVATLTQGAVKG